MLFPQATLLAASALGLVSRSYQHKIASRAIDWSRWKPGVTFQIILHNPMEPTTPADIVPANADVWDIDLQHATEDENMIPTLKAAGKIVLCYFNAGAVQEWDDDVDDFPAVAIGNSLNPPYTDERYLDIRNAAVVNLMKKRLEQAARIGCDGVDPDNIDAWVEDGDDPTSFKLRPSDYATYIKTLAGHAHTLTTQESRPLMLGQKNAPTIAPDLASVVDFAVLETCLGTRTTDDVEPFCSDFQRIVSKGSPVFQIEYPLSVADGDNISQADYDYYCVDKNGNEGFSEVIKHASEQVDGWGQFCGLGREGGRFETPIVVYDDDE
ncbi:hypothetical protein Cob_v012062 [Colletotrichum orbiculare MAFF 240422]|uniref:alpha-galactosidase n=1 Tax=Colletotrichum orbiculare (strain 104-T / ATCC 96160 / CBS 514.97 / LARS 414 / MAFF 240422) TaxID=1213857 RepID=N4VIP8_COLOR|nr:hypothetical protein Cob_v012062 [Colletotrichum orbiculare MAFF 240422]